MKRLRQSGADSQILWYLSHQKLPLLDYLVEHGPFEGIPFLPVVPFVWRDCYAQFASAFKRTDASDRLPFPHMLTDRERVPDEPYYMLDVRLSAPMVSSAWQNTAYRRKRESRPLTLAETFALGLHRPEWILRRGGILVGGSGSFAGTGTRAVTDLWLNNGEGNGPQVVELADTHALVNVCLPSCRVALDPNKLWCDATDEPI
jgi:hypothetical protein